MSAGLSPWRARPHAMVKLWARAVTHWGRERHLQWLAKPNDQQRGQLWRADIAMGAVGGSALDSRPGRDGALARHVQPWAMPLLPAPAQALAVLQSAAGTGAPSMSAGAPLDAEAATLAVVRDDWQSYLERRAAARTATSTPSRQATNRSGSAPATNAATAGAGGTENARDLAASILMDELATGPTSQHQAQTAAGTPTGSLAERVLQGAMAREQASTTRATASTPQLMQVALREIAGKKCPASAGTELNQARR